MITNRMEKGGAALRAAIPSHAPDELGSASCLLSGHEIELLSLDGKMKEVGLASSDWGVVRFDGHVSASAPLEVKLLAKDEELIRA